MQHRRQFIQTVGGLGALAALSPKDLLAQVRQVRILYGFPAGSTGDSVARRVAERIRGSAYTSNPGVVENRPGAGGRIAVEAIKSAKPDGSVLALSPVSAFSLYPHIYPKLTYTPADVAPVSIAAVMLHGFAVGPMVPAEVKTLPDFLAWAKANPTSANFGSPGAGSMPHMLGALLGLRADVPLNHIGYRGTAPSINDLVGGQIAAAMNPSGDYLQYLKDGRVRVLATTGRERSRFLPDVPTFIELGFPDVLCEEWFGFYATANTPAEVIAAANQAITSALKEQETIDGFAALGLIARGSTPEEMLADQSSELERWGPLVKEIGFTADS